MRYVAGLDGGGTKTAVAVADETGKIAGVFTSGGMNLNGQDEDSIRSSIREMLGEIARICGGIASCAHIGIGAAGVSNPAVGAKLEEMVRQCGYTGGLTITGDHETAMYGALGGTEGMILIAGTGSICFGRNAGGLTHRAGGGGHLVDDEGSGYSIGRSLITAVLKANDGRLDNRTIAPLVFKQLQIGSVRELIGFVYDKSTHKKDIAALAPLLSDLCAFGDQTALAIAEHSAEALYELVVPVAERLSLQEGELAFSGSVLSRNAVVRATLTAKLRLRYPLLRCFMARQDAAHGAAMLALRQL